MNVGERKTLWVTADMAGEKLPTVDHSATLPRSVDSHFTGAEVSGGRYPALCDVGFLEDLNAFRIEIGAPIHVNSWYRDPGHNAAVGGASDSVHMYGMAADISFVPAPQLPRVMARFAYRHGFRRIGVANHYIHVDIGDLVGWPPAIWVYSARGVTSPAPAELVQFIKGDGA